MTKKKLPIGIQTFSEIREENYYYVDKTPHILRLIDEGKYYFLSRPRRFGKSLLMDTIAELFEGNQALFEGLYAQEHWNWDTAYPVIRLSFGGGTLTSKEVLDDKIIALLQQNQARLGIICPEQWQFSVAICLDNMIRLAHEHYGQKVVILVDEYDKPMLDNINHSELAESMRDGLRNLYSVIKDNDAHIKFAMLTGVSKFSKVSLFSGLNHLNDITLDADYSSICGYTDHDLNNVFSPELIDFNREQVKDWYNGYNWLGESVYNPFDLLLLFKKKKFSNYWFESGTPTFLINILAQRHTFTPELNQTLALESLLSSFDVDLISTEALMFQAGYLTIASHFRMGARVEYTLRYPNLEVAASLNGVLLETLVGNRSLPSQYTGKLYRLLLANDFAGLKTTFSALFSSIPNDWYRNNPIAQYEGYYASVFYSYFVAIGLEVIAEDVTNHGRIDMTVLFNHHIYIIEFKVVELNPEGKALAQIKAKNYASKYQNRDEPIHLIGVEFSKEQRNVVGFEVETVS